MKRTTEVGYTSYSFFVCIFKQTFEKSPLSWSFPNYSGDVSHENGAGKQKYSNKKLCLKYVNIIVYHVQFKTWGTFDGFLFTIAGSSSATLGDVCCACSLSFLSFLFLFLTWDLSLQVSSVRLLWSIHSIYELSAAICIYYTACNSFLFCG